MIDPGVILLIVAILAGVIILGTLTAVIIVLRRPEPAKPGQVAATAGISAAQPGGESSNLAETLAVSSDVEDIEAYLAEQRANLAAFELPDLSNSFKGTTHEAQRTGVVLHRNDPDVGLVAFTSQAFNPQNGVVTAETAYGKLELIITQGRAGVKWEGEPLGILDYRNQRILGPEGQLLGSMERPASGTEGDYYPVGFFGQKVADVTTQINARATLRWFGDDSGESKPAFEDLAPDLEDNQTLLLLGALMLEIGFMDLL